MKRKSDPRHQKRINIMQKLFAWNFNNKIKIDPEVKKIVDKLKKIDKLISLSAPNRPIDQINKVDLSILRLATFELIINRDTPPKVVIDEAIELGKEYGSESSPAFINGALGQLVKIEKMKI